ncbi:MAG: hypothetical protein ACF8XB_18980 [Planctomycetota bacterium JB042]
MTGRRAFGPVRLAAGLLLVGAGGLLLDRALDRGAVDVAALAAPDGPIVEIDLVDEVPAARLAALGPSAAPRTLEALADGRAFRFVEGTRVGFGLELPDRSPRFSATLRAASPRPGDRPPFVTVRVLEAGGGRMLLARERVPPDAPLALDADLSLFRGARVVLEIDAAPPPDGADPIPVVVDGPLVRGRTEAAPRDGAIDAAVAAVRGRLAGRSVVLVTLGGVGAGETTAHGAAIEDAVALDTVARDGLVFDRTFAASTDPGRSLEALLSGRWPRPDAAARPAAGVAERLATRGYATAAVLAAPSEDVPAALERGFRHVERIAGPVGDGRALAEAVVRSVESDALAPPFLLWLHAARAAPDRADEDDARRRLRALDAAVRAALEELLERGRLEAALLVVAGIGGEAAGGPEDGGGPGDALARVPWFTLLPADLGFPPTRVAGPCSLVDVAPTLLSWIGIEAGEPGFEGRDLVPRSLGAPPARRPLYLHAAAPPPRFGIHADGWTLLVDPETGSASLDGPGPDPDGIVAEALRARLVRHLTGPTGRGPLRRR